MEELKKRLYKILLILLAVLVIIFAVLQASGNLYIFLSTTPDNNTAAFKYTAKISKDINNIFENSIKGLRKYFPDAKLIYTNAYGSGFLKNNLTAGDFDYSAGIYTGEFQYTGNNSAEIAKQIIKMSELHQASLYSSLQNSGFYIAHLPRPEIKNRRTDSDIDFIQMSLKNTLSGRPYKIKTKNGIFIMDADEIMLPDYDYIKLYSRDVSYGKTYRKIMREISISVYYSFDLINQGKKTRITMLPETSLGKRLYKPQDRYFVQNVYTGSGSLKYLINTMGQMNKKNYFDTRMINYFQHFTLNEYGNSRLSISPVKAAKRLLQCTGLLRPILPDKAAKEITSKVHKALSNPTVALINDYYNANGILYDITQHDLLYESMKKEKEISRLLNDMEKILTEMINDRNFTYAELKPLFNYQKAINNEENLKQYIHKHFKETDDYLKLLMYKKMPEGKNFNGYMLYLNKILETAGIYNIKMYNDRPHHVYVFKDKQTKKININALTKMNNIYFTNMFDKDTEIEYMEAKDFYGNTKDLGYIWLRHNPNKLEDDIFNEIKKLMQKDKYRFHLRIYTGKMKNS